MAVKKRTKGILVLIVLAVAGWFAYKQFGPKVDSAGNKFTIAADGTVSKNGVAVTGPGQSNLQIVNGQATITGTDNRTYKWTGTQFV